MDKKNYTSSVTLVILGDGLEPEAVSQRLGLQPNQSWRKGEERIFSSGRKHVYQWGGWKLFGIEDESKSPLERQIAAWQALLSEKAVVLRELRALGLEITLDCYVSLDDSASIGISPELLTVIGGARVSVTMNLFRE